MVEQGCQYQHEFVSTDKEKEVAIRSNLILFIGITMNK